MTAVSDMSTLRKRIFEIIEVGKEGDYTSRAYDFVNMFSIVINLAVSVLYTFEDIRNKHGLMLQTIESITIAFFALDFLLRVLTAKQRYPKLSEGRALRKYLLSLSGLVDICSFLPYYLPIFFPTGAVAFRMFRIVRIFRLFRINAYYDSLSVITDVIASKKQQLISSVFLISVLLLASSLCMYSLENQAQPDVFTNAFSGTWWAVSTLLTVGYGDIYPITPIGQMFSIVITFLGVGMVAIPTGIISAGFVDQYSRIKRMSEYVNTEDVHFIKVHLVQGDAWIGRPIKDIGFPAARSSPSSSAKARSSSPAATPCCWKAIPSCWAPNPSTRTNTSTSRKSSCSSTAAGLASASATWTFPARRSSSWSSARGGCLSQTAT